MCVAIQNPESAQFPSLLFSGSISISLAFGGKSRRPVVKDVISMEPEF